MRLSVPQLAFLVFAYLLAFSAPGHAAGVAALLTQSESIATDINPSDPAAVRELVSRLSDQDVRGLLIERLDLVAETQAEQSKGTDSWSLIGSTFNGIRLHILKRITDVPRQIVPLGKLKNKLNEESQPEGLLYLVAVLIFAVIVGLLVRLLFYRLIEGLQRKLDQRFSEGNFYRKLTVAVMRLCIAFASAMIFIVVALTIAEALLSTATFESANTILRKMMALTIFAYASFDVVLSPKTPHRRLLNLDDKHAKFIHHHVTGVVALVGFTGAWFTVCQAHDLDRLASVMGFWLNLAVYLYFAFIAWRGHEGFSSMLRHDDDTPNERQSALLYPYFIIGVIIFTWFLVEALVVNDASHLVLDGRQYPFMALLIWAPAMDSANRALVRHLQPPILGEGLIAERAYHETKRSYIRIGRVILIGIVLDSVMEIWDIDIINFASAGMSSQFVVRLVDTLWIVLFGYLLWELTSLWINRKLAAEQTAAGLNLEEEEIGGEGGGAGSSRLSTVLPLLRWAAQTVIATTTILLALGELGVDTTPLLAGAGVVGLAIGFGAQKLVTDVVSGIFFLIDDAFRDGEYVDIEGTVGTVAKISLRSMQLRHHRGPVHTIPYGEIPKVTNFSRDWVIMKLRFTVPFDTDLHKVKKIFKKIGQDLQEIPEFAEDLLQPFKSQGVIEVDDVGIVIRGKFMAKPGKQFTLRKEIFQRVQLAFDENGLQFARKEVRVKVDGPATATLTEEDKQAIAAGAAESAEKPTTTPDAK